MLVGGCGYFLSGGGWWWVVVDLGGWWWVVAQFIIARSKILRENKIFFTYVIYL